MFVLNIIMDSKNVDVNVTPDKLQMFFKNENILLAIIKSSLLKMYNRSFKNISLDESSLTQNKANNTKINTFFSPKPDQQQTKPKTNTILSSSSDDDSVTSPMRDSSEPDSDFVIASSSGTKV
jgi:DNA mismatch repair protein PMS2